MTAYSIAQVLKHKGGYEVDIHVIDNNAGDGSAEYLKPFSDQITLWEYPKDRLQSHGIGFDSLIPQIEADWIVTMESDSFPTSSGWLEYYDFLIKEGTDCAGSLLQLSGGEYVHPCGMLFKKSSWEEARAYCDTIEYDYYPNMAHKDGFDYHFMVHKSASGIFLENPDDFIELAKDYCPYTILKAEQKRLWYAPVVGPFHNGTGDVNDSIYSYGQRSIQSGSSQVILTNKKKMIYRVGYEPGQWFSYWHFATGKKVDFIPTTTKWIDDKPGMQQEFTMMRNGFKHLWGISAWRDGDPSNPIAAAKQALPEKLYDSLPDNQKI